MSLHPLALVVLLGSVLTFSGSFAEETKPDDILGTWLIEQDDKPAEKIEIYRCGDLYCGKIVWLKEAEADDEPAVDFKNKDDELKDRPLLGLEVMTGYRFDGEETWKDGRFYAHQRGKSVSPRFFLLDKDHLKIQIKILFVKKSFVWQRVAP